MPICERCVYYHSLTEAKGYCLLQEFPVNSDETCEKFHGKHERCGSREGNLCRETGSACITACRMNPENN